MIGWRRPPSHTPVGAPRGAGVAVRCKECTSKRCLEIGGDYDVEGGGLLASNQIPWDHLREKGVGVAAAIRTAIFTCPASMVFTTVHYIPASRCLSRSIAQDVWICRFQRS